MARNGSILLVWILSFAVGRGIKVGNVYGEQIIQDGWWWVGCFFLALSGRRGRQLRCTIYSVLGVLPVAVCKGYIKVSGHRAFFLLFFPILL